MPQRHYVAVAYDIGSDRRRTRAAEFLEGYAQRVQKSVFETELEDRLLAQMLDGVREFLQEGDGFRVYRLPATRQNGLLVMGGPERVEFPSVIIA